MASKYDIPRVFTDYQEMIEKADLQAVVIITPDDLHYPMTMDALDAGLHVLCEKPLACTAAQAKEMYEKAHGKGVKHMTFLPYRWLPHYTHLRALLDEGYIGRCLHCSFSYLAGFARGGEYSWRYDRQRANGALGDLGTHMIDLARWYVGEIADVSATLAVFVERRGSDGETLDSANDAAVLTVRFANGVQGSVQASAVAHVGAPMQEHHIRLHGDGGTLALDSPGSGAEIRGMQASEDEYRPLEVPDDLWGDVDLTAPYFVKLRSAFESRSVGDRLFIDSILQDRPIIPSFYDGFKSQEVVDAAIASHDTCQWVRVNSQP
jgi:predicted dehydrogenase